MTWSLWFLLAAFACLFCFVAWRCLRALSQIRRWLARLARKDYRMVILDPPFGLFRRTSMHLREITETLRRQSRQLSEEGFSLRTILGSMVEGVMIVDPSLSIRVVNAPLCQMFGITSIPLNRNFNEVFRLPELRDLIERTFSSGQEQRLEISVSEPVFQIPRPKSFEIYSSPLHAENERVIRGAVVVFHDVTEVKKLEKTRREFVANVSHEFRTPLAIISGYLETLRDDGCDDRALAGNALEIMSRHCDRLNHLIGDLLVISRLEQQQTILHAQRVRLDEIITHIVDQVILPGTKATPEIIRDFSGEDLVVEGDPWRLEQVFTNLLANALRYGMRDGLPPRITLTLRRSEQVVEFRCSDNGPGIPKADQPHIFERFYRVHKDRSRDAGGTGLGLSIVKNIVLAHGGSVDLESTPGNGSTFIVRLPSQQANSPAPSKRPTEIQKPASE